MRKNKVLREHKCKRGQFVRHVHYAFKEGPAWVICPLHNPRIFIRAMSRYTVPLRAKIMRRLVKEDYLGVPRGR